VSQLISQLEKSTQKHIVEITSDSDNSWVKGSVFVGTEAALFRVPNANTVVFADIDRDLSAPRITAPREVAALLIRAARLVGPSGAVVIQTRSPHHPLLQAFAHSNPTRTLHDWGLKDIEQRRLFGLPPFSVMASVSLGDDEIINTDGLPAEITTAIENSRTILKASTRHMLSQSVDKLREMYGSRLRVHADPTRY
jgi:primosomal protein N'